MDREDIQRREIIKLDGCVNVAKSYRIFKIIEYLVDTFEDMEGLGDSVEDISNEEFEAISGFLSSLYGNQIPVTVEAVNYRIYEDRVEHIQNLDSVEQGNPISMVAYLNRDSLWDDPLTVFSEDTEFTIYGRVITDKVDWNPLRLTRVLEEHFPDQAKQVNIALKTTLLNLEKEGGKSQISIDVEKSLEEMLSDLREGLEGRGHTLGGSDLTSLTSDGMSPSAEFEEYTEAREELEQVLDELNVDMDSDEKAKLLWDIITGEEGHMQKKDDVEFEIKPIGVYW
ncbi:hypothetical protein VNG_1650H [Halobacterium salinarum NRC-1]|uniref:Uncharacterized protein n=1 Tax=Halobacterium salinarum (strain ATCC 700922 / JCM 11081 / NRC-1) TaxID=64091 RepID=Q9HPG2_HALSA|nr:hypothetical protein [Halobacterium salinarum]AAG19905.1 hypothetical protein VNG_1650H [Halobacterium salinarum NRC-1]DAC78633.1 TPA_inf: uncharacterized protein VNG_1650H [Halobacterium salinarum NRC-1]